MINLLSAILYISSGILLFLFIKKYFSNSLATISSLFYMISPWHLIHYNDLIPNIILFTTLLISFLLSKKLLPVVLFLVVVLPFIFNYQQILNNKISEVPVWQVVEQRGEHQGSKISLVHNKVTNYSLSFLDHYFKHFSGEYLFMIGDLGARYKVLDFGLLYLFDLPFLLAGLFIVFKELIRWKFLLSWLALSPLVSAATFSPPSSSLSILMLVPLVIISSLGFLYLLGKRNKLLTAAMLTLVIWEVARFIHNALNHVSY